MSTGETGQQGLLLVELLTTLAQAGQTRPMAARAVQWVAEQLDAEVAAVVRAGEPVAAVGLLPGDGASTAALLAALGDGGPVDLPGLPGAEVVGTEVPDPAAPALLVVARAEEPFDAGERLLLLGTGRLLGQALQAARALRREREQRERGERLAREREELLRTLQERELVLSTVLTLQRAISHRRPLEEVLDLLCDGAQRVLGGDEVVVVLENALHRDRFEVRAHGTGGGPPSCPDLAGHGAEAVRADAQVHGRHGDCTWRAAPVRVHGRPVGALLVVDAPGGTVPATRHLLATFTEHAGAALNDAHAERTLRESFYDQLTRLPNRALFLDRLGAALEDHERCGRPTALLFLDLDGFKAVNDRCGHEAGDAVLQACAERVRECLRPQDTAARLGGDEFAVLLDDVDVPGAVRLAERLLQRLRLPVEHEGRPLAVGCSIGVAAPGQEGTTAGTLLRDADTAMYAAKRAARPATGPTVAVFERSMREARADRLELEADLAVAAAEGQLRLHYQPTVSLADGSTTGVEALVRWQHPSRGLLPPDAFIAVAEESGAVEALGSWVLREACAQTAAWRAAGAAELTVAVNLSVAQLRPGLVAEVLGVLRDTGLPASALVLEVTETVLVREGEGARDVLARLRSHGVRVAVDDFGTGYSSLAYLRRLPVDVLKVDRSFVQGMSCPQDAALVRTVLGLARALGLETVAEGVENGEHARALRELGCDRAQGYHWSRPVPAAELSARWAPRRVATAC
ncbi:putative bifunctional diguanylate cyclase/phosphodiesterase [Kineococcus sp. G2]|uniref:putative bifunctional diguanylate cyclase/phosphodiesterase n=1 Tax=Kineococcus sp. G2 TaxID=3127484 RepID=UPI00301D1CC3